MRLKEFIIFIIIFTIIYFVSFAIYDYFKNNKDINKKNKNNLSSIDIEKYYKFANFYNIKSSLLQDVLTSIYNDLKQVNTINISTLTNKYNISIDELIVIIQYLEYIGILNRKSINKKNDLITNLNDKEDTLVIRYSLMFSNKYDYQTILKKAGLGSDKELDYLISNYLVPGVKIENSTIYYVGDLNE